MTSQYQKKIFLKLSKMKEGYNAIDNNNIRLFVKNNGVSAIRGLLSGDEYKLYQMLRTKQEVYSAKQLTNLFNLKYPTRSGSVISYDKIRRMLLSIYEMGLVFTRIDRLTNTVCLYGYKPLTI